MKWRYLIAVPAVLVLIILAPRTVEAKRDLGDYTLRLHIYGTSSHHNKWGYHAVGRGNLFDDQGAPHGVEFTYDCEEHLLGTSGNEAYPAKWKKPGLSIEVVFGVIGSNPDTFQTCEMKVAEKAYVFYSHDHDVTTETPAEFLAKHKSQTPTVGPAGPADVPVSANEHR